MSDLVVRRWTRYGKDRLYVETSTGEKVGFHDLQTGQFTVQRTDLAAAFHEAVSAHQTARGRGAPEERPPAPPEAATERPAASGEPDYAVTMDWNDLAVNRPGQAVRAEAESLLAKMKDKSRFKTFLARAVDAKTDERAFRVGAAGEEAVGPRLERLVRHGWHVLHSIPVGKGKSDIDHLLIGPGGVYTVNTKNHPGGRVWVGEHAIRVNGQPTQYLRNSRFEAQRVSKALQQHLGEDVPVRGVLVFLTSTVVPQVTIKQMPDVLVLDRMDLPGVFKRATPRLDERQVDSIYAMARRSTTWL